MRIAAAIAILLGACFQASAATTVTNKGLQETVLFRNGDSLKGELISFDRTNGIAWMRPELKKPVHFDFGSVTEIYLGTRPAMDAADSPTRTVLEFHNGNELVGSLLSITNDRVMLDTAYAGKLKIPLDQVATILPRARHDGVIFNALHDDKDWTHGDMSVIQGVAVGDWMYHNGSLVGGAAASVARGMNLPFQMRMDFDMYWQNSFQIAIGLHTDSLEPISLNAREQEPDFAPFYSFAMSQSVAYLRLVPKTGPIRQLGQPEILRLTPGTNHAKVSIFTSDVRKSVALMMNGRLIREWIDPQGWSAGGRGVRFVHQGFGNVRIANLRVKKWDGKSLTPPRVQANANVDVMLFRDTAILAGQFAAFTNGAFHLSTGGAVKTIPFNELNQLSLATQRRRAMTNDTNQVTVYFTGRGRLTGQLKGWGRDKAELSVPGLGDVSVRAQALGRIKF